MKRALTLAAIALMFCGSCATTVISSPTRSENTSDLKLLFEAKVTYKITLLKIMQLQEQKLGIKYRNVPDIKFTSLSKESLPKFNAVMEGEYDSLEDIVYLDDFYVKCQAPWMPYRLESFNNWNKLFASRNVADTDHRCEASRVRGILAHELGHAYMNQLSQKMGNGPWPDYPKMSGKPSFLEYISGLKIVSEGIAEYFWKTIGGAKDDFSDSGWAEMTKHPDRVTYSELYDAAFHFVKPIIDEFGEKGLEYLIKNPPVVKRMDFRQMPKIQLLILKSLRVADTPK